MLYSSEPFRLVKSVRKHNLNPHIYRALCVWVLCPAQAECKRKNHPAHAVDLQPTGSTQVIVLSLSRQLTSRRLSLTPHTYYIHMPRTTTHTYIHKIAGHFSAVTSSVKRAEKSISQNTCQTTCAASWDPYTTQSLTYMKPLCIVRSYSVDRIWLGSHRF